MRTEPNKTPFEGIKKVAGIAVGAIIIVGAFAAMLRLCKIMVIDCRDMGL